MSDIYDILQAQATALGTVPVYGATVLLDKPPAGEDPQELIYLEPVIAIDATTELNTVVATWTAIIVKDPAVILEAALTAQDSMVTALMDSCVADVRRQSLGERSPWAGALVVSVSVVFLTNLQPS